MVKIPDATMEAQERIKKAKELLHRLSKGERMLDDAFQKRSMAQCFNIIKLYASLSKELLTQLEECEMIYEFLFFDKEVVLNKNGRAVNLKTFIDTEKKIDIDPWTLLTLEKLVQVFGEGIVNEIEFAKDNQFS